MKKEKNALWVNESCLLNNGRAWGVMVYLRDENKKLLKHL